MKPKFLSLAIALIVLLSFSSTFAQNARLKSPLRTYVNGEQQLVVCYDFSGLGNVSSVDIIVSYDMDINTYCYNRGQRTEPVPGLTQHYEDKSFTEAVPVHNGRARSCITSNETIQAGACPPGMARTETTVSYTNITVEILGKTYYAPDASQ